MSYVGFSKVLKSYVDYQSDVFVMKDASENDVNFNYFLGREVSGGNNNGGVDSSGNNNDTLVRYVRIENRTGNGQYLQLREVEAYDNTNTNVALFKPATQSSSLENKRFAPQAVDGVKVVSSEKMALTANGNNEWWEVDLVSDFNIQYIKVYNRVDFNLQSRLNDFRLVLLNENREELFRFNFEDGLNEYTIFVSYGGIVQEQEPYNVALDTNGGVATQSSRYGTNDDNYAIYSNNGIKDGDYRIASVTEERTGEWLRIDFNGKKRVEKVVYYTLQESWAVNRWKQYRLELLDEDDNVLTSVLTADYNDVNKKVEIPFSNVMNVKAVRLVSISDTSVQLKELEVYGIDIN